MWLTAHVSCGLQQRARLTSYSEKRHGLDLVYPKPFHHGSARVCQLVEIRGGLRSSIYLLPGPGVNPPSNCPLSRGFPAHLRTQFVLMCRSCKARISIETFHFKNLQIVLAINPRDFDERGKWSEDVKVADGTR